MSDLLSGIWRNSDHTLLVQIYDGEAKPINTLEGTLQRSRYGLRAMVWVIDRKDDALMIGDTFISVLPKRETWID